MLPFQLLIAAFSGGLPGEQAAVIAFLREENRVLKAWLTGQRLRFNDGGGGGWVREDTGSVVARSRMWRRS